MTDIAKVAFITGCASGVGVAIALHFAANVLTTDNNDEADHLA